MKTLQSKSETKGSGRLGFAPALNPVIYIHAPKFVDFWAKQWISRDVTSVRFLKSFVHRWLWYISFVPWTWFGSFEITNLMNDKFRSGIYPNQRALRGFPSFRNFFKPPFMGKWGFRFVSFLWLCQYQKRFFLYFGGVLWKLKWAEVQWFIRSG